MIKPVTDQYLEAVGLKYYADHKIMQESVMNDTMSGDRLIYGYYGYPYICRDFGDVRFIARTFPEGVGYSDEAKI